MHRSFSIREGAGISESERFVSNRFDSFFSKSTKGIQENREILTLKQIFMAINRIDNKFRPLHSLNKNGLVHKKMLKFTASFNLFYTAIHYCQIRFDFS